MDTEYGRTHPILINRPLVASPDGVKLCRPSEAVLDILPAPQRGAFAKEDGQRVVDAAGRLLAQAVEQEAEAFLAARDDLRLPHGRPRLVRHGHSPERQIQTGIGALPVSRVKLRDRGAAVEGERVRFSSAILPRWARRTKSLDALLPVLYLHGVSTGDFQEALEALLGKDDPNLSPAVIGRLTAEWQVGYERWQARDLSARHYVYVWADGVYLQARMEDYAECILVLIDATPEGKKELVGFQSLPRT